MELGFEPEMVITALHKHGGDTSKAAEDLIKYGGVLPNSSDESYSEDSTPSTSSGECYIAILYSSIFILII